jgi:hypothetical protein
MILTTFVDFGGSKRKVRLGRLCHRIDVVQGLEYCDCISDTGGPAI